MDSKFNSMSLHEGKSKLVTEHHGSKPVKPVNFESRSNIFRSENEEKHKLVDLAISNEPKQFNMPVNFNIGCFPKLILLVAAFPILLFVAKEKLHEVMLKSDNANVGKIKYAPINNTVTQQGEISVIAINSNETEMLPSKFQVRVYVNNTDSSSPKQYIVTFVSHRKYTGSAKLLLVDKVNKCLLYEWQPRFPGQYEILVHHIKSKNGEMNGRVSSLIQHSFQGVSVTTRNGNDDPLPTIKDLTKNLIPCQSTSNVDTFVEWDGDWIGPDLGKRRKMNRYGWSFLPSLKMNCSLETFSKKDLFKISEKKSIYILGTSRERGVFLSLVDLLLSAKEKKELPASVIGKCWGRAVVKKGNIELLYQDFRSNNFQNGDGGMECHNGNIAIESHNQLLTNATLVWNEIFKDKNSWPTVVYLTVGYYFDHFQSIISELPKSLGYVERFVSLLPTSWNGTLFLGDYEFSASEAGLVTVETYEQYIANLKVFTNRLNDNRIRWLDGMGISKEQRMYGQEGEKKIGASQHFQHWCYMKKGEVRVCSNITEMVGQLLLGHALGPRLEIIKKQHTFDNNTKLTVEYCQACPTQLIPFHIIPYPKLTCRNGDLQKSGGNDFVPFVPVLKKCPQACLNQQPNRTEQTESDVIDVRFCL